MARRDRQKRVVAASAPLEITSATAVTAAIPAPRSIPVCDLELILLRAAVRKPRLSGASRGLLVGWDYVVSDRRVDTLILSRFCASFGPPMAFKVIALV